MHYKDRVKVLREARGWTQRNLAARLVPALERRSITEAVIRLYDRMKQFDDSCGMERLMEIAEDNQLSEDERDDFVAIAGEIRELIKTGLEMFLDGSN